MPTQVSTAPLVPFQDTLPLMHCTIRVARTAQGLHRSHPALHCPRIRKLVFFLSRRSEQ